MFPYATKVYRDYLKAHLPDDVRVATDVPATRPRRLVTITTAPAGATDKPRFLSWRRLIFQCRDVNEFATGELCEQVRHLVVESVYAHIGVRRVRVVGEPARLDDPDDSTPRFQMTADALFRANR